MLIASGPRKLVCWVPLFFLVAGAFCLFAGIAQLRVAVTFGSLAMFGFGLALAVFCFGELRLIRVRQGVLIVTTVFGTKRLDIASLSLGVRVNHGAREGTSYRLYALAGSEEVELTLSRSEPRIQRHREVMARIVLGDRQTDRAAKRSAAQVARREAKWRSDMAQARALVARHDASGKPSATALAVAGGLLLLSLGSAVYLLFVGP